MSDKNGNTAYIVSSVRTAVGKAKRGTLKDARPVDMAGSVVKAAVERVKGLDGPQIDDVILGTAYPEGPQGMNMGRVVAQRAGLPDTVAGTTINRFCSSGLQTIAMASQAIEFGSADVVVAGGVESMSMVPMTGYYLQLNSDIAASDPDVYIDMGNTAENVAEKYNVSREDQDKFALQSHERALAAIEAGNFEDEIVPLHVEEIVYNDGKTEKHETEFKVDEGPRGDSTLEALGKLRAVFRMGGSVTAGNSSQMSDGAAATVVMSGRKVEELGVQPMGRLISFAVAGVAPEVMGIGPIEAIPKALKKADLRLDDIGLIELNEAFASQSLAIIRELGLNDLKVNVNGGAIALGHPLGCTGAKLTATLLNEMKRRGVRYGIVTMCIGGGMGAAGVIENLQL